MTQEAPQGEQQVVPGSDEYNQMMAAKFRGAGDPTPTPPTEETPTVEPKPENGHDKFYNAETGAYDWKSHAIEVEYRAKQGTEKPKEEQAAGEAATDQETSDAITKAGLDPNVLEQQLLETGALDADSRAALVKSGIPESLIDIFVSNYTQVAQAHQAEQLKEFGGKDEFEKIKAWGLKALTQEERDAFGEAMRSPYWKYAAADMKSRYEASKPLAGERPLVTGDSVNSTPSGFRSKSEMVAAMSDPRYNKDKAYQEQVARKMANATWDLDRR